MEKEFTSLPLGDTGSFLEWAIRSVLVIIRKTSLDITQVDEVKAYYNGVWNNVFKFDRESQYDFIRYLFETLYDAVYKKQYKFLLCFSINGDNREFEFNIPRDKSGIVERISKESDKGNESMFRLNSSSYNGNQMISSDIAKIEDIVDELFLQEHIKNYINFDLTSMDMFRTFLDVGEHGSFKFPDYNSILSYINSYINLCIDLFSSGQILADGDAKNMGLFESIMNIDTNIETVPLFNEKIIGKTGKTVEKLYISIYSPYVLAALANVYIQLWNLVTDKTYQDYCNSYASVFVEEMVVSKLLKSFGRYYIKNQQLFFSSLSINHKDNPFQAVQGFKWRELSSIEPINLIDLYEKILNYAKTTDLNLRVDPYEVRVCVFGYSEILITDDRKCVIDNNLRYLYNRLQKKLKDIDEKLKLKIDIIMNNHSGAEVVDDDTNITIKSQNYENKIFSNSFKEYIKIYDMIFVMDTPQLYKSDLDISARMPIGVFVDRLRKENFNKNSEENSTKFDKFRIISDICDQLVFSSQQSGEMYGYLMRSIRTSFFDMVLDEVQSNKNHKEVFLFTSSYNDVDISRYDRLDIKSMESKNGKTLAMVKMSNQKPINYLIGDRRENDNHICFNLWNLVKNIAPVQIEDMFMVKKDDIYVEPADELDNIRIKLEWVYNKDSLPSDFRILWASPYRIPDFKLFYEGGQEACEDNEERKSAITKMFLDLFNIIFTGNKKPFLKSVGRSFGNIFMGRIDSIYQLLTYHLIMKGQFAIKECIYDHSMEDNKRFDNIYKFNVKDKSMYYEIMRVLDNEDITGEQITYNLNRARINGVDVRTVVSDIRRVCENMNYTYSPLYENIFYRSI